MSTTEPTRRRTAFAARRAQLLVALRDVDTCPKCGNRDTRPTAQPITREVALEAALLREQWRAEHHWLQHHTHTSADCIPGTDMYNCVCEVWDGTFPTPLELLHRSLHQARTNAARRRQQLEELTAAAITIELALNSTDPAIRTAAAGIIMLGARSATTTGGK